jgi:hypothetical protein
VHFYSTFWSLKRSNRGTVKFFQPVDAVPRRRALAHRAVPPALAPTCSLPRPRAPRPPRPEPSGVVPWRTALRRRTRVPPVSKGGREGTGRLKAPSAARRALAYPHLALVPGRAPGRPVRAAAGAIVGSHDELRAPVDDTPNQTLPHLPLHPTKLAGIPVLPTEPHRAGTAGSRGHHRWPPAPPLADLLPTPSEHGNRSPGTQGPSPARARPAPGRRLAGIWPDRRWPAARDHIAKR